VCLTCVGGHSFSHSMNTHEPFVRFDRLLDSFSCGLGRVREHAYRASLLVHDFVLVMLLSVLQKGFDLGVICCMFLWELL
jgi:hypothetical protein